MQKLIKTILIIIIPIAFLVLMTVVISNVLGFDLGKASKQWASHVPIVSKMVGGQKVAITQPKETTQLKQVEAQLKQQQQSISQYKDTLASKDAKISELQAQNTQLQKQLKDNQQNQQQAQSQHTKMISDTYASMDPSSAAAILSQMKDTDALSIIANLDNDVKAKILENMPTDKAASLSLLLANTK